MEKEAIERRRTKQTLNERKMREKSRGKTTEMEFW